MVRSLHEFESLLRRTLAAGGQVAAAMANASETEGLSAVAGHQVFASIITANLNVSTALSDAARGHRLLEGLAGRLGYSTVGFGDGQKDPSVVFTNAEASQAAA